MQLNILKVIIIIFAILYQSEVYSRSLDKNKFNHRYLSNYFSALLAYDNQKNKEALKYFNSSKSLTAKHENYLKEYVFSLIADGQVSKAIKQVNHWKNHKNSNFFEANLLIILDSIDKKNYKNAEKFFSKFEKLSETSYEFIIQETLKSYNDLFLNKEIKKQKNDFGKLNLITSAFQNCYLNPDKAKKDFISIINSDEGDYSRYLFFYLETLIENKDYNLAKQISSSIDPINSTLLLSQTKKWIKDSNYKKFNKYFSCKNETDILSEFFFLISNLYSSRKEFEKSNFYLNISNYLNPKFFFNLTLLTENHFDNKNFVLVKQILEKFNDKEEIYYWYKIKKMGQVIGEEESDEQALIYVEKKFNEIQNPDFKILFDMANIYKNFKRYEKAIKYYSIIISNLNKNSEAYADAMYRRGGSYERLEQYNKSDSDLLKSLEINPQQPYVLNYLAYSWLERNYKIDEAIEMLKTAYQLRKNDPYIIDSIGWGYYLIGDYLQAEKYLIIAVQLMPDDPIVNDHYGDILWKLDRKLQAKYFWKNVLNLEDTEEEMKKKILLKLLDGPDKT